MKLKRIAVISSAVVGVVACAMPSSSEDPTRSQKTASTVVPQACEGYKPHVDGDVGKNSLHCPGCTQRGHLARTVPERNATCGPHEAPGVIDATNDFYVDRWRYKNRKATPSCIEVIVTQYTGKSTFTHFYPAAYLGSFDPTDIQKNYLGDSGNIDVPEHRFKFTVDALAEFEIVLVGASTLNTAAAEAGASYRLDVLGCGQIVATDVTPSCGAVEGGTKVTIKGSGLRAVNQVTIGSEAHDVVAVDDETVTAVTSATAAGTYDVKVTALDYGPPTSTVTQAFTYGDCNAQPPPPPPSDDAGAPDEGNGGGGEEGEEDGGSAGKTW